MWPEALAFSPMHTGPQQLSMLASENFDRICRTLRCWDLVLMLCAQPQASSRHPFAEHRHIGTCREMHEPTHYCETHPSGATPPCSAVCHAHAHPAPAHGCSRALSIVFEVHAICGGQCSFLVVAASSLSGQDLVHWLTSTADMLPKFPALGGCSTTIG
jgi:hypothetical protein